MLNLAERTFDQVHLDQTLEWVEAGSGSRRCVTAVDAAQGLSARQVPRVRVIRGVAEGQSLAIRHPCIVRTFSGERALTRFVETIPS